MQKNKCTKIAKPKNPLNNFILKNCLSDSTNIVKNSNKTKNVYGGYGKAFKGCVGS